MRVHLSTTVLSTILHNPSSSCPSTAKDYNNGDKNSNNNNTVGNQAWLLVGTHSSSTTTAISINNNKDKDKDMDKDKDGHHHIGRRNTIVLAEHAAPLPLYTLQQQQQQQQQPEITTQNTTTKQHAAPLLALAHALPHPYRIVGILLTLQDHKKHAATQQQLQLQEEEEDQQQQQQNIQACVERGKRILTHTLPPAMLMQPAIPTNKDDTNDTNAAQPPRHAKAIILVLSSQGAAAAHANAPITGDAAAAADTHCRRKVLHCEACTLTYNQTRQQQLIITSSAPVKCSDPATNKCSTVQQPLMLFRMKLPRCTLTRSAIKHLQSILLGDDATQQASNSSSSSLTENKNMNGSCVVPKHMVASLCWNSNSSCQAGDNRGVQQHKAAAAILTEAKLKRTTCAEWVAGALATRKKQQRNNPQNGGGNGSDEKEEDNDAHKTLFDVLLLVDTSTAHQRVEEGQLVWRMEEDEEQQQGQPPKRFDASVLVYVEKSTLVANLVQILCRALVLQLQFVRRHHGNSLHGISAKHFAVPSLPCLVTLIRGGSGDGADSAAVSESDQWQEWRAAWHARLAIPVMRPYLRDGQAIGHGSDVSTSRSADSGDRNRSPFTINEHKMNVHTPFLCAGSSKFPSGLPIMSVTGNYAYFHYNQDGIRDAGWGCAYRTFQSIFSWFVMQHYIDAAAVPSHHRLQELLVELGDKPFSFIGSSTWVGSIELSFVLQHFLKVPQRIVHMASRADVDNVLLQLQRHFSGEHAHGKLVPLAMVGVSQRSFGIAAIAQHNLLIVDPHHIPGDRSSPAPVYWVDAHEFLGRAHGFANVLLPRVPDMI